MVKPKSPITAKSHAATEQAQLIVRLWNSYVSNTSQSLLLIDVYLFFVMLTGIIQFIYVILAGNYPYNAFLAGFIVSVGNFVLAGILEIYIMHLSPI